MVWLILLAFGETGFQSVQVVDDTLQTDDGFNLVNPRAAIYWDDDLYIADMNLYKIFVLREDGAFEAFGVKGNGPGEFVNFPVNLSVREGLLRVEEWNRWREYFFESSGRFVRGNKIRDRRTYHFKVNSVYNLLATPSIEIGQIFQLKSNGCHFGKLESRDWEGVHLSRAFLFETPDGDLVSIKKSGIAEVFDGNCRRMVRMPLALEHFKLDLEEDKLSTLVSKTNGGGRGYSNGTPVIGAALRNLNQAWILVKNELDPNQRFLFEINLSTQTITWKQDLPMVFDHVSFFNGFLSLISPSESTVATFLVK